MSVQNEFRYAVRSLRRTPGFTALAVGTLALGIGATAAIFSVVRGVLLEPLPYPDPDRLVQLWQIGDEGQTMQWPDPNFLDVQEQTTSFEAMGTYSRLTFTVIESGEASRVPGAAVSKGFFAALGVAPARGRVLQPDDQDQGAHVVVVSHRFWQRTLGGRANAVGGTLRIGDLAHVIVGVLPPRQGYPADAELWIPGRLSPANSRTAHNSRAIARLAGGVTLAQANRELGAIADRIARLHGDDTWMASAAAVPLHDELVGNVRPALLVLLSAAGLLLLIACANVANLLLARAASRSREMAVRLALGAGIGRILRQLLSESAVLALAAGAIGILVAIWGVDALLALEPGRLPRLDTVGVDWLVLLFTVGVAAGAATLIGLVATIRASRTDVRAALSEGDRGGTGVTAGRLQGALVAAQVALALVLLVGAGLLSRSFLRLIALDPGYRTSGALALNVTLPTPQGQGQGDDPLFVGTPNPQAAAALHELLTRLRAVPGVTQAGAVNAMPLAGGGANGMFLILDRPDEVRTFDDWSRLADVPGRTGFASYRVATPGYFEAMEIPLLRGRLFDDSHGAGPLHAAVISRSLAETKWPDEDPLGKLIQFGNMDGVLYPFTVVGVVGDVRDRSLEREPEPTLYGNAYQRTTMLARGFDVVVAGPGAAASLIPTARDMVREITPDGPARFHTLDELFSASLSERRFSLLLLGVFAVTALLLAAMGIYGVISYAVAQRTREIGIRMALGAERGRVLRLMVGEALILTGVGLLIGVAGAWVATRVLANQLYGVGALDPITFLAVATLLALATVAASYAPARRATRINPMEAFRQE